MLIRAEEKITAPEFPGGLIWLNSSPRTLAGLRGKIVLIDIWDYTCINCVRTLPYLKEWQARYAPYGLVIIGVHTPEFEFAKQKENVESAIRRLGIIYPVVLDNGYRIWSSYANQFWPRNYLIDAKGHIVHDHAGEGNYHATERAIQENLQGINARAPSYEPFTAPGAVESGKGCYRTTPELYLGYDRGRIGNREGYLPGETVDYHDPGHYVDAYVYASGPWENLPQSLRHARRDEPMRDSIAITYHAASVNAVIGAAREPDYRVVVKQDDAFVPRGEWGEDMQADGDGRTFLEISEPRMYRVVRNARFGQHVLKLFSPSESFAIYSFTFGSCEVPGNGEEAL